MKPFLSVGSQSVLAMVVGLLLGVLLWLSMLPVEVPPTLTPTSPALPGGWMVRVFISRTHPPEIISVQFLDQVRRTSSSASTHNRVQILDSQGQVIFEQGFETVFFYGEPPTDHEVIEQIIRLPDVEGATTIRILTLGGEVEYDLSEQ